MPTLESARDALVSYALSCVGLSAHPSNAPAAFGRAVAPYGPPAWVQSLCAPTPPNAANSTCEVFAVATDQAVAEQFGISGLARPLAGAVEQWAWFVGLAKKLGAHRTVSKDGPPTVGAIVHVESASSRHWYRVVEARPGTIQAAWNFVTVDGGQNDRGYQAIAKCARGIRGGFEVVANGSLGRTVIDWIDSPALLVALAAGGSATATSSPRTSSSTLPVLRRGASGDLVRRWQTTIGVVPADGSFGPATEVATKDWQAAHSLNPDGVVGARSWAVALAELPAGSSGPAPAPATPAGPGATWEALDIDGGQSDGWDIPKVRAAGVPAVWCRATDGVNWVDSGFALNVANAREIGAEPGGYHFLRVRHGRPQDAGEQARQHVVAARAQGVKLASWLDVERGPENDPRFTEHNAATREEWHVAIWDALSSIEEHSGIPPVFYSFVAHIFWLKLPPKFTRWKLCVADYRALMPNGKPRTVPGATEGLAPWAPDAWAGWQYAASPTKGGREGRLDGIPIPVDRSRWQVPLDSLRVPR